MRRPLIGLNSDSADPAVSARPAIIVNRAYAEAVLDAGGAPVIVPCLPDRDFLEAAVASLDGFLFVGGKDYPSEYYGEKPSDKLDLMAVDRHKADFMLARIILRGSMPAIGICAGCQLINIASGGRLVQHLDSADDHTGEKYHEISLEPGSRLRRIFGSDSIEVNSSHHQACDAGGLGFGLTASAFAPDGVVEAIEGVGDRFLVGVQWHPERTRHLVSRRVFFESFVEAAREARGNGG